MMTLQMRELKLEIFKKLLTAGIRFESNVSQYGTHFHLTSERVGQWSLKVVEKGVQRTFNGHNNIRIIPLAEVLTTLETLITSILVIEATADKFEEVTI